MSMRELDPLVAQEESIDVAILTLALAGDAGLVYRERNPDGGPDSHVYPQGWGFAKTVDNLLAWGIAAPLKPHEFMDVRNPKNNVISDRIKITTLGERKAEEVRIKFEKEGAI